ncbi:MAG: N-acetylglucosamine-6-phosphate deacetylase [Frankiales bacterium]|nr:N-acetylglucosamine-6-phosphate deacetylase [Frankiales bacterium]
MTIAAHRSGFHGRIVGRDPATGKPLAISVADGKVTEMTRTDEPTEVWISPGLIDLQVNGFHGFDVNAVDVSPETISSMVYSLNRIGVTTVVPTIVTAAEDRICAALRAVAAARDADSRVAHSVPYVHVEGPFLSVEDGPRGAHDLTWVRPADISELRRWQQACDGLVGVVTISPHDDRAIEFIAQAAREGVRCAIGHTHASPEQVTRAADAGATMSTHLGNGAHISLPRHPNYIWAQLADDRLSAGLIADGHHLPADVFRVMLRAKGNHLAHLVSDATAVAGLAPGIYDTSIGQQVELSADGRLAHVGTPYLAGASRSLADGVAIAIGMADISLAGAVRLATLNPGQFVGGRGRLVQGATADIITYRWEPGATTLEMQSVLCAGELILGDT